jgi:hypothetical protein
MIKIFDDFAPKWLYERNLSEMTTGVFPWYWPSGAYTDHPDVSAFGHELFHSARGHNALNHAPSLTFIMDHWFDQNKDWFKLVEFERCRANLYTPGQTVEEHIDTDRQNRYSLLYYVNDSDGGTTIDGEIVEHKANRAVLFNSNIKHQAIKNTSPARISINMIMHGEVNEKV